MLRSALSSGVRDRRCPRPTTCGIAWRPTQSFSLVDNETIEAEILSSRLASGGDGKSASWEFTDLRSRMTLLDGCDELECQRHPAASMCWLASGE
jgi:hypothetical protein